MEDLKNWLSSRKNYEKSVILLLIKGYFLLTLLCLFILIIPLFQSEGTSLTNHVFFAVSIVSTTGLAPADIAIKPLIQAIMIGQAGNKGFAFSTDGYSVK